MAQARALLDRARVISDAPAASPGGGGSRPHPDSRPPQGENRSTLGLIGAELQRVTSDDGLIRWLAWAGEVIHHATHSRTVKLESAQEFRMRVCTEYEGSTTREIAFRERISVDLAGKIRREGYVDSRGRRRVFQVRDGIEIIQVEEAA